jgi:hypothetical protein
MAIEVTLGSTQQAPDVCGLPKKNHIHDEDSLHPSREQ